MLAIIPARGGSKGVPGKNIYPIDGLPLIRYSIDVALNSNCFSHVVVTSDDKAILKAADVPGVILQERPRELAQDDSSIIGVIKHSLDYLMNQYGYAFDAIMLLQATSPIREIYHIQEAIEKLTTNKDINSVISVSEMKDIHPARMYNIQEDRLVSLMPELEQTRRQDIIPVYYRNGSIYLVRTSAFLEKMSVMAKPAMPLLMSDEYLVNIDEPRDLVIAEVMIKMWKEKRRLT